MLSHFFPLKTDNLFRLFFAFVSHRQNYKSGKKIYWIDFFIYDKKWVLVIKRKSFKIHLPKFASFCLKNTSVLKLFWFLKFVCFWTPWSRLEHSLAETCQILADRWLSFKIWHKNIILQDSVRKQLFTQNLSEKCISGRMCPKKGYLAKFEQKSCYLARFWLKGKNSFRLSCFLIS